MTALKNRVIEAFRGRFRRPPAYLVCTPGRVNLIGEHTDYNGGFVFPFAIDRHIAMAADLSDGGVELHSVDHDETVQVDPKALPAPRPGHWSNYLIGVMAGFRERGLDLPGLRLSFSGSIPGGGGLSSSAALSNSMGLLLDHLTGAHLPRPELARISQLSEHRYAGVMCGIMDQFVTLMGKKDCGLKLDCRSLEYTLIPLQVTPYRLVLCNSNVKHELASSEYNTRRAECESALAKLRKKYPELRDLRDLGRDQLESDRGALTDPEYRRALHQVEENRRVLDAEKALLAADLPTLGRLMVESHQSLDRNFEVTCPELNSLVGLAMQQKGVIGARMTGGGFGGNTINLVHRDSLADFGEAVKRGYKARHGLEAEILECLPSEGGTVESLGG